MQVKIPFILKNLNSTEDGDLIDTITKETFNWGDEEHIIEETIERDDAGAIRNVFRTMAFSNFLRSHEYNFGFIKTWGFSATLHEDYLEMTKEANEEFFEICNPYPSTSIYLYSFEQQCFLGSGWGYEDIFTITQLLKQHRKDLQLPNDIQIDEMELYDEYLSIDILKPDPKPIAQLKYSSVKT